MSWNSASEFFTTGGHALYVWGAYLLAAGGITLEAWLVWRRYRRALREARSTLPETRR